MRILCIDPGTTNLGVAIFEEHFFEDSISYELIWQKLYSPGKDSLCISQTAIDILNDAQYYEPVLLVIEDQQPFGQQSVLKWNSFVQGAITSLAYRSKYFKRILIFRPSDYKKRFGIAKGERGLNKKAAVQYAQKFISDITSDHIADCFVLFMAAKYFYLKGEMYTKVIKNERFAYIKESLFLSLTSLYKKQETLSNLQKLRIGSNA